jgi:uncharacterized membrane protein
LPFKDGTVLNRPRDRPGVHSVSKRLTSDAPQSAGSWFGSAIVILGAIFLLFTLNESNASRYQAFVNFVFHNAPLMFAATAIVWLARSGQFGNLPGKMRALATILLPFFCLFSFFALINSQLVWTTLEPIGLSRTRNAPLAIFAAVILFLIGGAWLLVRGFFRWMGTRYQHHGVALGFGPLYFYFRKRRSQ